VNRRCEPHGGLVGNRALDDPEPSALGAQRLSGRAGPRLAASSGWIAHRGTGHRADRLPRGEDRRVFLPCAISCDGAIPDALPRDW